MDTLADRIEDLLGEGYPAGFSKTVLCRLYSLEVTPGERDLWLLVFCMEKVLNKIKDACNIRGIPEDMRIVAADMACGEYLFSKKQSGQLMDFDLEQALKTVNLGDTSVTFDNEVSGEQRLDSLIAYLLDQGKGAFACYRKIRW